MSPTKMGKGTSPGKGMPSGQETPSQLGGRASLEKQMGGGEDEPDASGEGSEDRGLSQGEDKVDETDNEVVTPGATAAWCGTQVAELDQQEFLLMGGKWAGKGAVRKVVEIQVNVSDPPADWTN